MPNGLVKLEAVVLVFGCESERANVLSKCRTLCDDVLCAPPGCLRVTRSIQDVPIVLGGVAGVVVLMARLLQAWQRLRKPFGHHLNGGPNAGKSKGSVRSLARPARTPASKVVLWAQKKLSRLF